MPRILIAYSTVDGHTLKICRKIQQCLQGLGQKAVLFEMGGPEAIDPTIFDKIIIGASIRYGKYRPDVFTFIDTYRQVLDAVPTAFFSVNVVARKPGRDRPESNPYIRLFKQTTSWQPTQMAVFAGKIDYPRYRFMDRQMIRFIMWITKGPTDPGACVEFTDWGAVDRFANQVAMLRA